MLIKHNDKEVSDYIVTFNDNFFSTFGYDGIPSGVKEYFKEILDSVSSSIVPNKKFMLGGTEEMDLGEDEIIRTYFDKIGYMGSANTISFSAALTFAKMVLNDFPKLTDDIVSTEPFYHQLSLIVLPKIDTSKVTTLSALFYDCDNLLCIPKLDTSNVIHMNGTFYGCHSLRSIPLLDTSNLETMDKTFHGCSSLTTIPLLDTSNLTSMYMSFRDCISLKSIPELDTSKVTNMKCCFDSCYNLTTIPKLDTRNVTDFHGCFFACSKLRRIEEISFKSIGGDYKCGRMFIDLWSTANNERYNGPTSYILIKDIGTNPDCTLLDFRLHRYWGNNNYGSDSRQSLIDSLLTYSFDRRSAGYNDCRIYLDTTVYEERLTGAEKTLIQNKGYILLIES